MTLGSGSTRRALHPDLRIEALIQLIGKIAVSRRQN